MSEVRPKISQHPVAARQIARVRAWAALIGFVVAFWLSRRAGMPFPESGARAIAAGIVCRLLAWAAMVSLWRQLIPAQIAERRRRAGGEASGPR